MRARGAGEALSARWELTRPERAPLGLLVRMPNMGWSGKRCLKLLSAVQAGALATLSAVVGDSLTIVMPLEQNGAERGIQAVVELGRVRIHFFQVTGEPTREASQVRSRVHSLAFPAADMGAINAAAAELGLSLAPCKSNLFDAIQQGAESATTKISTKHLIGIDLVLRAIESEQ